MKRIVTLGIFFTFVLAFKVLFADNQFAKGEFPERKKQKPIEVKTDLPQNPGGGILLSGDCSDYIDLTGQTLPIDRESGTTVGATNNYGPFPSKPLCWSESGWWAPSGAAPDVTYKWTAPYHGRFNISLLGSNYDTVLLLYNCTCPTEPVYPDDFICGNDDFAGTQSELSYVPLAEGQEVLIVVDGYAGHTGQYVLSISAVQTSPVDSFIGNIMETYPIPGMQACVIKNGDIIWTGAYGDAYINLIDVTDSTIFSLASISKTVTGTALMQLYEDGLIGLDDDINDYLPFHVENPNFPGSQITPRMLAAHTSSILDHYNTLISLTVPGDSPIPLGQFLEDYLTPGGAYYNPSTNFTQRPPGDSVDYSNVATSLAAYLVELINPDSVSFALYCEQYIFEPLDMDETGWLFADFADSMNIAMPYNWVGGNHIPWGHYGQPHFPAGQLRSSSLQMGRFLTAIMQYGQLDTVRILDSTSVALMNSIQFPLAPGMDHPGQAGIGWFFMDLFGKSFWGHLGRWHGAMTGMFYCPNENTGVIVLSNEDFVLAPPFPDENMFVIYELFELASGWPYGYMSGIVNDESMIPIEGVLVSTIGLGTSDYTDSTGGYFLHYLSPGTYDISFSHNDYYDTVLTGITITAEDTVNINIQLRAACDYVVGDVNGSDSYNGLDITYGVAYLKGGPPPPYECNCPPHGTWYVAGDANGSCSYNGLDITYGVAYFKGGSAPVPCADCPPVG